MPLVLPPLYAMLDPEQIKSRAPQEVLAELLEGGAKIVQLRAKAMPPREVLGLAKMVREATQRYRSTFIMNDRTDIAIACGADGVHLGQEDLPLHAARKLIPNKIIGISTHDLAQAKEAEHNGADYIGFGPMFGTQTKDTGYPARGLAMLKAIRAAVNLPIVAIGGINETNVSQVWQAGADSAAIISDILHAEDIRNKVARITRAREATRVST
ncbi:MAG: thiamine phosphate synthase [Deltaproteobacteria bacterium]|nr:thiamine phosphate synthase [Deltaproteobacteria bacterium]